MVQITPVTLEYDPRPRWFDPGDLDLTRGDAVIVHTQRGAEFGYSEGINEVEDAAVAQLPTPLQPVERIATDADVQQHKLMIQKGKDALDTFKELAAQTNKDMRPIMVEYTFDGDRAIFFFEAEDRVDFRELVRKLASKFHVHIDMHQIGVRDEARMVGGIGPCGQELCCRRMGEKFHQVTIRMAKEQGLSLNPEKVSGLCGRLMCCLRYEYDAYHEFNSRAPKYNATISTPEGPAKVVEINVPKESITVKLDSDENKNRITFPLSAMDAPTEEGRRRPNSIGDVFEKYAHPDPLDEVVSFGQFDTDEFTQDDKLSSGEVRYNPSSDRLAAQSARNGARGSRSGENQNGSAGKTGENHRRRLRRRRSHTTNSQGRTMNASEGSAPSSEKTTPRSMRPGRHSSSLSHDDQAQPPMHHRRSLHRHHISGSQEGSQQKPRASEQQSQSAQQSQSTPNKKKSTQKVNHQPRNQSDAQGTRRQQKEGGQNPKNSSQSQRSRSRRPRHRNHARPAHDNVQKNTGNSSQGTGHTSSKKEG